MGKFTRRKGLLAEGGKALGHPKIGSAKAAQGLHLEQLAEFELVSPDVSVLVVDTAGVVNHHLPPPTNEDTSLELSWFSSGRSSPISLSSGILILIFYSLLKLRSQM